MRKFVIEDHLCRSCGGRILRCVEGAGLTPGGNPLFICADCGTSCYGFSPEDVCWCGQHHKGQEDRPYLCLPFRKIKEQPELEECFLRSGCVPKNVEFGVGVVLVDDLRKLPYDKFLATAGEVEKQKIAPWSPNSQIRFELPEELGRKRRKG